MASPDASPPSINFDRAEYAGNALPRTDCGWCGRGLAQRFYLAAEVRVCDVCGERVGEVASTDSTARFLQTAAAGAAAGIVGSGVCLGLLHVFSFVNYGLGIASVGVGYAGGKAMQTLAPPVHGRRYQITAAFLTYAAVVMATSAALLGLRGVPLWAYPFLLLAPLASLALGHAELGLLQLFLAGMAMRWAWVMMRPVRLTVTGPWPLENVEASRTAPSVADFR